MFKGLAVLVFALFMTACSTVMAGYNPTFKPKELAQSIVLCADKESAVHLLTLVDDRDTLRAALEHPNFPCGPSGIPVTLEEFVDSGVDYENDRLELWLVSNPQNPAQTAFAFVLAGRES